MFVVSAEEMRRVDLHTIQTIGIPALVLMENAGRAVAEEGMELFDGRRGVLAVLAGKGNNGGDGLVAARHLIEAGYDVKIIYAEAPESFRGEAAIQRDIASRLGIPYEVYDSSVIDWRGYSGIMDALLGTGSRGAPREAYAALIGQANLSGLPILSVDLPSGLDADTGQVFDSCIRATRTVALAFTKRGLEQYPGAELAGEVKVRYIGIPQKAAIEAGIRTFRVEEPLLSRKLRLEDYRLRRADSHKGTYGHVLVAAGSRSMSGAGLLSAKAALRGGSGLVTWPCRITWPSRCSARCRRPCLRGWGMSREETGAPSGRTLWCSSPSEKTRCSSVRASDDGHRTQPSCVSHGREPIVLSYLMRMRLICWQWRKMPQLGRGAVHRSY